ncbi:MAG: efflux RND transporter permease subunit [candidate division WOR-3 bacterium]|nr:MAG: efflux RND transporter permease subunit [candidate division WOR-3 bacterium]
MSSRRFNWGDNAALWVALAATFVIATRLGAGLAPRLEEEVIQVNITMPPSISLEEATEAVQRLERIVLADYGDEVVQTISKIGRPEAGGRPHPVNSARIQMELRPEREWRTRWRSKQALLADMSETLGEYPGIQIGFTQPTQNMFDELLSGVKKQLAVKLFGDDPDTLRTKTEEVRAAVEGVPGLVDLSVEETCGQPQVQIVVDREACARYGVKAAEVLEAVELGVDGEVVDRGCLDTHAYGINVRVQHGYRRDPGAILNLLVHSHDGTPVPLGAVAEVRLIPGQQSWTIAANVRGRDIGSVVAEMRRRVEEQVRLPPGYRLKFGGHFESQKYARQNPMSNGQKDAGVFKKLLVLLDGSEYSVRALETAAGLARAHGATLTAVTVSCAPPAHLVDMNQEQEASFGDAGRTILDDARKVLGRLDFEAELKLVEGAGSADSIVDLANGGGYDLVVLGWRGLNSEEDRSLGGVSDAVLRRADCPVMLVR